MDETMCYVGRMPCCNKVVAVTMDDGETDRSRLARELASWVRHGMVIERTTLETVRGMRFEKCTCRTRVH